jgi:thiamine biosynthesis protein ThiI
MHLIAQKLLRISGYDAVITGESIGQASSQTLKNIRIVEECLPSDLRRPIIRPLSTMDKEEIIKLSRKLGFYEKSSKLREVCVVASGPVTTRADIRVFKEELNKLNMKLIDKALDDRIIFNITEMSAEALTKILLGDIEIDYIPKDAILIDARPDTEYQKRHPPGSIHISQLKYVNLPKNKTLIVYCDEGSTSISWAKALRLIGFKAFSLKGGTRKLKELIEF